MLLPFAGKHIITMRRLEKILKRIGKFLLWTILVLGLLIGAFVFWLRIEPAEVTECDAGFRLFQHSEGADCIPNQVERVIAFGPPSDQFFLAVDFAPAARIGFLDEFLISNFPELEAPWLELTDGLPDIGGFPPSIEALLTTDPDVIISGFSVGDANKLLEQVAPVVVLDSSNPWKENMRKVGEVIGEQEAAEQLIADYEARVENLRSQFDDPSEITVSHVRVFDEGQNMRLPASFGGQIITEVGFSFPEAQLQFLEDAPAGSNYRVAAPISDELVSLLDADVVLLYGAFPDAYLEDTTGSALVEGLQNDPVFQTLDAVQNGTVYEVDLYWGMSGIYAAHAVLDDLFIHVAGVDPEEVAPNPLKQ
ncbi:MAG: iron-siderophore ABC transporter substrate-binding protein [Chloroflexota bacterium]